MPKILVIDDDDSLRAVIVRALRDKGHKMIEADDGVTALRMARIHQPDLMISDVIMGEMDGFSLLEKVRQEAAIAATPFILMTGEADFSGMRQGMSMGADDYLPKPFTPSELVKTVEVRLHKLQAMREEADERLTALRTNISLMLPHELLTPLNGILGIGEIMNMDPKSISSKEISEFGQMITESGEQLHRLVKNFLIYAQIEMLAADSSKLAALRNEPGTEVSEVLQAQAKESATAVARVGDLKVLTATVYAAISRENLTKLAEELLDNALKFSEPGSMVKVTSEVVGPQVVFTITDSGRGMKPEFLENIGAYTQFERKIYEQRGSGLGLAIAKRLVEIHGGRMVIDSQPGLGTSVRVHLPMAAPSVA
jgi:two-component system, sensor histidine kinase and response regulator